MSSALHETYSNKLVKGPEATGGGSSLVLSIAEGAEVPKRESASETRWPTSCTI